MLTYAIFPWNVQINTDYPGLQLIHERPYIFIVNEFLNEVECNNLLAKVRHYNNLSPLVNARSPRDLPNVRSVAT